jgi:LPXTG-site transpeptidase (sortase) family protein
MQYQDDILAALDAQEAKKQYDSDIIKNSGVTEHTIENHSSNDFHVSYFWTLDTSQESLEENDQISILTEKIEVTWEQENKATRSSFVKNTIFGLKYIATSVSIFAVLLLASNYSAYWNIAKSVIFAQELEETKKSLIESVAAGSINEEVKEKQEVNTFKNLSLSWSTDESSLHQKHSLTAFVERNTQESMDIEITPYDNRIVIPKIGRNIPLVDITHPNVQGVDELNDIFMKELENGVVRYPGSAKPGEKWNAFIFGHSSNFPWMKGNYNDVFALLDKVVFDDEVIVYYGQEKFVYKIHAKNVIRPWDVSVLKSNPEIGASEITLMTCWPIGTTLNRLVLTGKLVRVEK